MKKVIRLTESDIRRMVLEAIDNLNNDSDNIESDGNSDASDNLIKKTGDLVITTVRHNSLPGRIYGIHKKKKEGKSTTDAINDCSKESRERVKEYWNSLDSEEKSQVIQIALKAMKS